MRSLKRRSVSGLAAAALVAGSLVSTGSPALADSVAPNPPTDLVAIPSDITDGPVVLEWTGPTNETIEEYQIFRSNGGRTASVDIYTFLETVSADETIFVDELPSEGVFRYAVVAVDDDGQASAPSNWVAVVMDDGNGSITPDTTAPDTPANLSLDGDYVNSRALTLTWDDQTTADLWRYLVFRADNGGEKQLVAYVTGGENQLTDIAPADGTYAYYLVAQDQTGNYSALSAGERVVVDTVAPDVRIATPVDGKTYTGTQQLAIDVVVEEGGSGYTAAGVQYYVDDDLLSSRYIDLADLEDGRHTVRVTVTDRAGNVGEDEVLFVLNRAEAVPGAPEDLLVPRYSNSRSVTLDWSVPASTGIARYDIYRAEADGAEELVGSTRPAVTTFTDTVTADGDYNYRVVAHYTDGQEATAAPVTTTVDTVAPVIRILEPAAQPYSDSDESIAVEVVVQDATSGVARGSVAYLLDGEEFDGETIDLADLEYGEHTFRVEAVDRAGNKAAKSVRFTLEEADEHECEDEDEDDCDEDEDEDDEDEQPVGNPDLLAKLESLRGEIHHGHYNALNAFIRNGNLMAFRKHVEKFAGKFISEHAAEELLEALGVDYSAPVKGNGKTKGPKW